MIKPTFSMSFTSKKKGSTPEETTTPTSHEELTENIVNALTDVGVKVAIGVGLYIAADTLRQVIVKIAPQH
jgi:hypothetical protein